MITVDYTLEDRRLRGLVGNLARERDKHLEQVAKRAETHMKQSMRGPKHGLTYGRGVSKWIRQGGKKIAAAVRIHRASAPGEAPAIDYGVLVNSIRSRLAQPGLSEVAIGAKYGRPLEYGTRNMAARPFVRPAVEAVRKFFQDGCQRLITRSLR